MILSSIRYSSVCHGGALVLVGTSTTSATDVFRGLTTAFVLWLSFRLLKELNGVVAEPDLLVSRGCLVRTWRCDLRRIVSFLTERAGSLDCVGESDTEDL